MISVILGVLLQLSSWTSSGVRISNGSTAVAPATTALAIQGERGEIARIDLKDGALRLGPGFRSDDAAAREAWRLIARHARLRPCSDLGPGD